MSRRQSEARSLNGGRRLLVQCGRLRGAMALRPDGARDLKVDQQEVGPLRRALGAKAASIKGHAGVLNGFGDLEGIRLVLRQRGDVPHPGGIAFVHRPQVMTGTAVEEVNRGILAHSIEVTRLE